MKRDDLMKNISWEDDSEQDKDSNSTFEEGLLFSLHISQLLIVKKRGSVCGKFNFNFLAVSN